MAGFFRQMLERVTAERTAARLAGHDFAAADMLQQRQGVEQPGLEAWVGADLLQQGAGMAVGGHGGPMLHKYGPRPARACRSGVAFPARRDNRSS